MIEELGHEVVFVDYKIGIPVCEMNIAEGRKGSLIKRISKKISLGKNKVLRIIRREKNSYVCFVSDFNKLYLKTLGIAKEKQYQTEVEILIIGSDEVFNCTQGANVGFSKELFGADNCAEKVVSYAASFGNTTLEKLEKYDIKETVRGLLKNFSELSVRDLNSYKIIKELTGVAADVHLDPVLVYDFTDDVEDIVAERDYIIIYAYNKRITKEEGEVIRRFASEKIRN